MTDTSVTTDNVFISKIMPVILWLNESVFSECGSQAVNPGDVELGEQSARKLGNILI